jgi:phospholipid-binding lipoprotein MlaA
MAIMKLLRIALLALVMPLSSIADDTQLAGQVTVPAEPVSAEVWDPLEKYNRWMFNLNRQIDDIGIKPAAEKYRAHTPEIVKLGIRNFFSNIDDIGVLANSTLQGKLDQALDDSARVALNTLVGIGGVIDVATMLDIEKNNEDFGQTFGHWGVPEGPYIVLPLLGPRTLRSATGTALDTWLQVEALGAVSEASAGQDLVTEMMAMRLINEREQMLSKTALLDQAALDPYTFARDAYLAYRRCLVADCDKVDYVPSPESEQPYASDPLSDDIPVIPPQDEIDLLDEID